MPKFTDDQMETHGIGGSNFQFSGTKIEHLGATEYTLGVIVVDASGSVYRFWDNIKNALKETVKACRKNPRADNMMLRVILFSTDIREVHGFKALPSINESDYDTLDLIGSVTTLFDASYNGIQSATEYGKTLLASQYMSNASVFVITDGMDNASKLPANEVAKALEDARTSEALESIMPVLIGVNTDASGLNAYLDAFQKEAGFQQYIAIGQATEAELAKLGGFISSSISSQSQALGTGGVSQSLTF